MGDKSDPPVLVEEIPIPIESELDEEIVACGRNSDENVSSSPSDLLCEQDAALLAEKLSECVKMDSNAKNVLPENIAKKTRDVCREIGHKAQSGDDFVEDAERESAKNEVEGEVSAMQDNFGKCDFGC